MRISSKEAPSCTKKQDCTLAQKRWNTKCYLRQRWILFTRYPAQRAGIPELDNLKLTSNMYILFNPDPRGISEDTLKDMSLLMILHHSKNPSIPLGHHADYLRLRRFPQDQGKLPLSKIRRSGAGEARRYPRANSGRT